MKLGKRPESPPIRTAPLTPHLDPRHTSFLEDLAEAPFAWATPGELAQFFAYEPAYLSVLLCDLQLLGKVSILDRDSGPVISLSRAVVEEWGLELAGNAPPYRWRRPARSRAALIDPGLAARLPDPSSGPEAAAEIAEAEAARVEDLRRRRRRAGKILHPDEIPRPIVLMTGHPLWPWDERDWVREHSIECPRCRVRRRGPNSRLINKRTCECGRGVRATPRFGVCLTCYDRPLGDSAHCLRCGRGKWDPMPGVAPKRRRA